MYDFFYNIAKIDKNIFGKIWIIKILYVDSILKSVNKIKYLDSILCETWWNAFVKIWMIKILMWIWVLK